MRGSGTERKSGVSVCVTSPESWKAHTHSTTYLMASSFNSATWPAAMKVNSRKYNPRLHSAIDNWRLGQDHFLCTKVQWRSRCHRHRLLRWEVPSTFKVLTWRLCVRCTLIWWRSKIYVSVKKETNRQNCQRAAAIWTVHIADFKIRNIRKLPPTELDPFLARMN